MIGRLNRFLIEDTGLLIRLWKVLLEGDLQSLESEGIFIEIKFIEILIVHHETVLCQEGILYLVIVWLPQEGVLLHIEIDVVILNRWLISEHLI